MRLPSLSKVPGRFRDCGADSDRRLLTRGGPGTHWIGIRNFAEAAKDSGGSYLTEGGFCPWHLQCFSGEEETTTTELCCLVCCCSLQADVSGPRSSDTCYFPESWQFARAEHSAPRGGCPGLPAGLGRTCFSLECLLFVLLQAKCFYLSFKFL